MTDSQLELAGSVREQLTALRKLLIKARHELIEAEAQLADERTAVNAFKFQVRLQVGQLVDMVHELQKEMRLYLSRLHKLRQDKDGEMDFDPSTFGETDDGTAEAAARVELSEDEEAESKRIYRRLARRYHPDFAVSAADRQHRTQLMAAVNQAYASRDMSMLRELDEEPEEKVNADYGETEAQVAQSLRAELARCRRRMREINRELEALRNEHAARLLRDSQEAELQGRDLLAEIASELERKILRLQSERDFLKLQFEQHEADEARR